MITSKNETPAMHICMNCGQKDVEMISNENETLEMHIHTNCKQQHTGEIQWQEQDALARRHAPNVSRNT